MTESEPILCRGIRFPKDDRIITAKVARKLGRDQYETPEIEGVDAFIKPGDRVLELGAGIGFMSSYLNRAHGITEITCVEANPLLCDYVARVHSANDVNGAKIVNAVALSGNARWPEDGTIPFYVTEPFWSSSLDAPKGQPHDRLDVPVVRLSDLVDRARPSVIVCDIEGAEADLFAAANLDGVKNVLMELHTRVYGGHGIRRTFDNMHRLGFFYHQKVSAGDVVLFERLK